MNTQIAFVAALTCAICYGLGAILQQIGSQRAKPATTLNPRNLLQFAHHFPYVAGLLVDFSGWILSLLALRVLPLFLVQAAITSSVAINAVFAHYLLKTTLPMRSRWIIGVIMTGLVLLAFSAAPDSGRQLNHALQIGIFVAPFGLLAAGIISLRIVRPNQIAIVLAVISGIVFSGVAIIARSLVIPHIFWHVIYEPMAWALVVYGILGELTFSIALQRGHVTMMFAILFAIETVIPTAIGIAFLGDQARTGWWPAAIIGLVLIVGATILLSLTDHESLAMKVA